MQLTKKQEEGLKIAVARYKNKENYTCIAGYAGTGKSTLVQFIISSLGLNKEDVAYVAYTGKAAQVLREKGCANAITAHRLLYQSFPRPDGTFIHKPRKYLERKYDLIVVDEISMLPKEMWELLLFHKTHVIALGDPGQLPPIGEDNGILAAPHIFLDEIMRQEQESEIIRLTMDIREGKPLELFKGKEVQIIDRKDLVSGMYLWADQIICATNKTRNEINNLMREYLHGKAPDSLPIEGEKIICLRNNWDIFNKYGDALVNGLIGTIENVTTANDIYPPRLVDKVIMADFIPDHIDAGDMEGHFEDMIIDYNLLIKGTHSVNKNNFKLLTRYPKINEFEYGYCITCWKAQGSEFDKVLVFEEAFPFNKEDHIKYLYTAATRAKKKLVIVRAS